MKLTNWLLLFDAALESLSELTYAADQAVLLECQDMKLKNHMLVWYLRSGLQKENHSVMLLPEANQI